MRAFFWLLIFLVYLIGARWFFICRVMQQCTPTELPPKERLHTLTFQDRDSIILMGYDHFSFDTMSKTPDLNENNITFLDSVSSYLNQYPKKYLSLSGSLGLNEQDQQVDFYDNLGIARANEIRKLLTERGIPENQITLDYEIDSTSLLRRPIAFTAYDSTGNVANLFTFTNMTFSDANFEYNSAEFKPGSAFVAYADSVKTYMENKPEVQLQIIGHTDSIASQNYNLKLGLDRAKSAREYFQELGLSISRIEVSSMGKNQPVAPNKTEEGRQKNRRVDLVLK